MLFRSLSDRRQLAARGFAAPSALWALLTPLAYLIARRLRVPGSRALVIFVVTAALAIVVPPEQQRSRQSSGGTRREADVC